MKDPVAGRRRVYCNGLTATFGVRIEDRKNPWAAQVKYNPANDKMVCNWHGDKGCRDTEAAWMAWKAYKRIIGDGDPTPILFVGV